MQWPYSPVVPQQQEIEDVDRRPRWTPPVKGEPDPDFGDWLAPGWVSEHVTTGALRGYGSGRSPTQAALRDRPTGEKFTGELPTYEMLYGSEETQEAIADYTELLTGTGDERWESITDAEMDLAPGSGEKGTVFDFGQAR